MGKPSKNRPTPARKIFVVEDHPVFREGLVQVLNGEPDLTVCGEAGTVDAALPEIARLKPDLVLVDITLPGRSGLALIKAVRAENQKVKLLVVSMHDEALYAARVLRAGGDGYIMKQEDPEEIVHAVRDVLNGLVYVSDEVVASTSGISPKGTAGKELRPLDNLTDLELEILELLGRGKSNEEIAQQVGLSGPGVEAHCATLQSKLNLKSVNQLIRYAVCWVEAGPE